MLSLRCNRVVLSSRISVFDCAILSKFVVMFAYAPVIIICWKSRLSELFSIYFREPQMLR